LEAGYAYAGSVPVHSSNGDLPTAEDGKCHPSSRIPVRMPTLSFVVLAKEVPPTRRNIRSRAEGKSGVISSENDDADAIISVKEIIGSDQVIHDWNRNRVALFSSVEFDNGDWSVQ
jgi:hypothetical protein